MRAAVAGIALLVASIGAACSPGDNGTVRVTVACHGAADCATKEYEQLTGQCSNSAVREVAIMVFDSDQATPVDGVKHTLPCPKH